jgi:hypothetical protein
VGVFPTKQNTKDFWFVFVWLVAFYKCNSIIMDNLIICLQ